MSIQNGICNHHLSVPHMQLRWVGPQSHTWKRNKVCISGDQVETVLLTNANLSLRSAYPQNIIT